MRKIDQRDRNRESEVERERWSYREKIHNK